MFSLLHYHPGIQSSVYSTTIQVYRVQFTLPLVRYTEGLSLLYHHPGIQRVQFTLPLVRYTEFSLLYHHPGIQRVQFTPPPSRYTEVQFTPPPFKYTEDVSCIWRYQGWGIPVLKRMMRLRKIRIILYDFF